VPVDRQVPPTEVPEIGSPARRALASAGLTTWDAVDRAADRDLLSLHGFGPKALRLLREGRPGRQ
jgi:hypothetical protein